MTLNEQKIGSFNIHEFHNPLECCDMCGSDEIIETLEGFTCKNCGVVLEIQRFEFNRPYDENTTQNSVLGRTQIGYKRERTQMKNSVHMEYLNKLDSIRDNEEMVKIEAKIEIKRILTGLGFPLNETDKLLNQFISIRSKLGKGTKYRSAPMLVPLIIYFYFKNNGRPIDETKLLELAKISRKDYNAFKIPMLSFWPKYQERNRQEYILQKILELVEYYDLGMPFYYQSKKIMTRFFEAIKNTKDNVIAGLVTSITLLCSERKDICIHNLCERLNIKMSTIQVQIRKKVFERFNILGFKSLVKSADMLRHIMTKLGVLDEALMKIEECERQEEEEIPQIVHIVLGSASPVHNFYSNQLIYKDSTGYIRVSIAKDSEKFTRNEEPKSKVERIDYSETKAPTLVELFQYHFPTGPPVGP